MANQYVNKVVNGESGVTLIDLTSDTAVASDVAMGKYFHLASGERVQGTASGGGGGGAVVQDQDGYITDICGASTSRTFRATPSSTAGRSR